MIIPYDNSEPMIIFRLSFIYLLCIILIENLTAECNNDYCISRSSNIKMLAI